MLDQTLEQSIINSMKLDKRVTKENHLSFKDNFHKSTPSARSGEPLTTEQILNQVLECRRIGSWVSKQILNNTLWRHESHKYGTIKQDLGTHNSCECPTVGYGHMVTQMSSFQTSLRCCKVEKSLGITYTVHIMVHMHKAIHRHGVFFFW